MPKSLPTYFQKFENLNTQNMYTIKDLDELIDLTIKDSKGLTYVQQYASTPVGHHRIKERVKQHILVRGIDNVDTALSLVESELQEVYIETL